jgi:UDP-glucose 4-epimerase
VRDYASVSAALRGIDIVFNAAALKQVPTCEYFPYEAVQTNITGPQNIVRAIRDLRLPIETVVGVSTDKAVKPVNVMGMTKSIQERILSNGNLELPDTRFIIVRYGNVLASRGSVIPLFHEQIRNGGPVTITHPDMTRFLLSLDEAVDLIFTAVRKARRGETFIPRVPSARMVDVASALIAGRRIDTIMTGVRPGEKLHEILVSEEESHRTVANDGVYVIGPILPELQRSEMKGPFLEKEYSSEFDVMSPDQVKELMIRRKLMVDQKQVELEGEFLR